MTSQSTPTSWEFEVPFDSEGQLSIPPPPASGDTKPRGREGRHRGSRPTPKEDVERELDDADKLSERFAEVLDKALRGRIGFLELVEACEATCHDLSDAAREEASEQPRATQEHVLRQRSELLSREAATWKLLWHLQSSSLYPEEGTEGVLLSPAPSEQEGQAFLREDDMAQRCLRTVKWLEALASCELDLQRQLRGGHVGAYSPSFGAWRQTQRASRDRVGHGTLVRHVDPDATSREGAGLHPEDQKLEEGLLEDVWRLLRAGRLQEARQLCRSAGQPWRAALLGGGGGGEPWTRERAAEAQALEMESGRGRQRRLWKWAMFRASEGVGAGTGGGKYEAAVYAALCSNVKRMLPVCRDWESACWAMARGWLDAQVDGRLAELHAAAGGGGAAAADAAGPPISSGRDVDEALRAASPAGGWPLHVEDQQPGSFAELFQRLHSSAQVHEAARRSCKEPHRMLQMGLVEDDIGRVLGLLKGWSVPLSDAPPARPAGHAHMARFGAQVVVALRALLGEEERAVWEEKLRLTGDLLLTAYCVLLFAQRHEELVAVYASQIEEYAREDLYNDMLAMRNAASVQVKQKIVSSMLLHLPFEGPGSVMSILTRVASEARATFGVAAAAPSGGQWGAHLRSEGLRKGRAVQWLCLDVPAGITDARLARAELTALALLHGNVLLREFALAGLGPGFKGPVEAHALLGELAPAVAASGPDLLDALLSLPAAVVAGNYEEYSSWTQYFACDALYRMWLELERSNAEVPPQALSDDERQRALHAALQASRAAWQFLSESAATFLVQNVGDVVEPGPGPEGDEPVVVLQVSLAAALVAPDGAHVAPDEDLCSSLASGLRAAVSDNVRDRRDLLVEARVHPSDEGQVELALQCLSTAQDHVDGGLLAALLAVGIKGELPRLPPSTALQVTRIDAWEMTPAGARQAPAPPVVRSLCRRCCLPQLVLHCLQMHAYISASGRHPEIQDHGIAELLATGPGRLHDLFSAHQLQAVMTLERSILVLSLEEAETRDEENRPTLAAG